MAAVDYSQISSLLGMPMYLIVILLIWSLIWKAIALWKAARRKHAAWFIVLLVANTMGILEILYIFLFSDLFKSKPATKKVIRKKK